ncbi:hypothetical protein [Sulfuracidifex metallicus]|uniref:hypothetical protein n=1 Tax=Sulfuracidifex metallicus TaxID=47303 RepID=UPI002275E4EF|nr:hypothetical protein [Sulfuracidifex metallicus]MCY0850380.1 hypothetical protein [Sulfuracidifex metallicus]
MEILVKKYQTKEMETKIDHLDVIRTERKRVEWISNIKRLGEYGNITCYLNAECQAT